MLIPLLKYTTIYLTIGLLLELYSNLIVRGSYPVLQRVRLVLQECMKVNFVQVRIDQKDQMNWNYNNEENLFELGMKAKEKGSQT